MPTDQCSFRVLQEATPTSRRCAHRARGHGAPRHRSRRDQRMVAEPDDRGPERRAGEVYVAPEARVVGSEVEVRGVTSGGEALQHALALVAAGRPLADLLVVRDEPAVGREPRQARNRSVDIAERRLRRRGSGRLDDPSRDRDVADLVEELAGDLRRGRLANGDLHALGHRRTRAIRRPCLADGERKPDHDERWLPCAVDRGLGGDDLRPRHTHRVGRPRLFLGDGGVLGFGKRHPAPRALLFSAGSDSILKSRSPLALGSAAVVNA